MAKVVKIKKKNKITSREELETLDKSELIDKILNLETQNLQLRQNLNKSLSNPSQTIHISEVKKAFNYSKCYKRHILLKLYYLGWNYHGFVTQEDTQNTIEHHLFYALMKSCCIESRETSNYHRCGRTDKGVSAFSQVISLNVRSRLEPQEQHNLEKELPYCKMLNRLLPKTIRCTAWSPANSEVSARFNCSHRTYKYFFPQGNLDIELMAKAAKYLIGTHDFRNFCKMDVGNGVVNFVRTIIDVDVIGDKKSLENTSGYNMCILTIKSQAFLWHQIRCIMGILFLIGRGSEKPEIILELLDIDKCPRKPQYNLAHEIPLNLFSCEYKDVNWYVDKENLRNVIRDLQEDWTLNSVKSAMIKCMLEELAKDLDDKCSLHFENEHLLQGVKSKTYKPLMKRITCESLENRIQHFTKKQRINITENKSTDDF